MKKVLTILLVISVWVGVPALIISGGGGCSTSGQRKAVNTLFAVGQSVDAAYKSYLDLVVAGQVKTNDVPRISQQYLAFQHAFSAAITLSTLNTNAPPSPELANAASQILLAIQAAKGNP